MLANYYVSTANNTTWPYVLTVGPADPPTTPAQWAQYGAALDTRDAGRTIARTDHQHTLPTEELMADTRAVYSVTVVALADTDKPVLHEPERVVATSEERARLAVIRQPRYAEVDLDHAVLLVQTLGVLPARRKAKDDTC